MEAPDRNTLEFNQLEHSLRLEQTAPFEFGDFFEGRARHLVDDAHLVRNLEIGKRRLACRNNPVRQNLRIDRWPLLGNDEGGRRLDERKRTTRSTSRGICRAISNM